VELAVARLLDDPAQLRLESGAIVWQSQYPTNPQDPSCNIDVLVTNRIEVHIGELPVVWVVVKVRPAARGE
jgi:hypothetical protein